MLTGPLIELDLLLKIIFVIYMHSECNGCNHSYQGRSDCGTHYGNGNAIFLKRGTKGVCHLERFFGTPPLLETSKLIDFNLRFSFLLLITTCDLLLMVNLNELRIPHKHPLSVRKSFFLSCRKIILPGKHNGLSFTCVHFG